MSEQPRTRPHIRIEVDFVHDGTWAKLSGSATKVLGAMLSRANRRAECWPSVGTIGHEAGLKESAVYSAIRELLRKGLLRVVKVGGGRVQGGKYETTHYSLTLRHGALFNPAQPCAQAQSNPARRRDLTLRPGAEELTPVEQAPVEAAATVKQEAAAADADAKGGKPPDRNVLAELHNQGIGDPEKSKLASTPGITVDAVKLAIAMGRAGRRDAPGGVKVKALREHLAAAINRLKADAERRAERQRQEREPVSPEARAQVADLMARMNQIFTERPKPDPDFDEEREAGKDRYLRLRELRAQAEKAQAEAKGQNIIRRLNEQGSAGTTAGGTP